MGDGLAPNGLLPCRPTPLATIFDDQHRKLGDLYRKGGLRFAIALPRRLSCKVELRTGRAKLTCIKAVPMPRQQNIAHMSQGAACRDVTRTLCAQGDLCLEIHDRDNRAGRRHVPGACRRGVRAGRRLSHPHAYPDARARCGNDLLPAQRQLRAAAGDRGALRLRGRPNPLRRDRHHVLGHRRLSRRSRDRAATRLSRI